MRALIWADLHAHNFREFSTIEDGLNTRLKDCADVVGEILLSAKKEKVDEVWFVGDLYHLKNNLDNKVIQTIMYEMGNLADNFPVYVVPGNHDYRAWSSEPILLEILNEMPGKFILCESGWLSNYSMDGKNGRIYIEPFTRKVRELNERMAKLETNPERDIFFGHQDIIGTRYGGFVVERGLDADILSKKFKWSFVGHWHVTSKVRENVLSIGAPLQHNFGDANQSRGWYIFDSEKGEMKFVANNFSPRLYDIKIGPETTEFPGDSSKDFYRIKVRGELPEFLNKLRWKRISRVVEGEVKKRTTISFSDKKEDIIEKYVKMRGGNLDHKKLVEMGRRYL